jgi:hypothetical protein
VHPPKSLAVCNPFAGTYRLLPPLGSAWARHSTVLAGTGGTVLVLTELAALSYTPAATAAGSAAKWMKHPLSLPSKPRSPVLSSAAAAVFALCDVGTPWRSQWKLFSCLLVAINCVLCRLTDQVPPTESYLNVYCAACCLVVLPSPILLLLMHRFDYCCLLFLC